MLLAFTSRAGTMYTLVCTSHKLHTCIEALIIEHVESTVKYIHDDTV